MERCRMLLQNTKQHPFYEVATLQVIEYANITPIQIKVIIAKSGLRLLQCLIYMYIRATKLSIICSHCCKYLKRLTAIIVVVMDLGGYFFQFMSIPALCILQRDEIQRNENSPGFLKALVFKKLYDGGISITTYIKLIIEFSD